MDTDNTLSSGTSLTNTKPFPGIRKRPGFLEPLILTVFFCSILIVVFVGLSAIETSMRVEAGNTTRIVLQNTVEAFRIWQEQRLRDVVVESRNPTVISLTQQLLSQSRKREVLTKTDALTKLRLQMSERLEQSEDIGFLLVAPDSINIGSLRDTSIGRKSVIALQQNVLFKKVLGGTAAIVPPLLSDVPLLTSDGKYHDSVMTMFVAAPVRDQKKDVIAVLAMRIDVAKALSRISKLGRFGKTGETYAFDINGYFLTSTRFFEPTGILTSGSGNLRVENPGRELASESLSVMAGNDKSLTDLVKKALAEGAGFDIVGYRDYRGVKVIGSSVWNEDIGIGLVSELDMVEALEPYIRIRNFVFGIVGALSALSAIMYVVLVRLRRRSYAILQAAYGSLEKEVQRRTLDLRKKNRAIEQSPAATAIVDISGIVEYINPRYCEIADCREEDILGRPHKLLQPGALPEEQLSVLKQAIRTGAQWRGEAMRKKRSGDPYWVLISVSPIRDEENVPTHAVIVEEDITERRLMEEALREKERQYRELVESASDIIYRVDRRGNFVYVNPAARKELGYTEKDMLGKHFSSVVHPHHVNDVKRFYLKQFAERTLQSYYELPILSKSGESVWVGQTVQLFIEEGAVNGFLAVVRVITDRKLAEDALKVQKAYFEQLFERAPEALVLLDVNDHVLDVNKAFEELFGYAVEEIRGRLINDLIVPETHRDEASTYSQQVTRGELLQTETRRKRKDGTLVDVSVLGSPIVIGGQQVGIYGIYRDISELKRSQEELKESEIRYRTLVENASDIIYRSDLSGKFVYANPTALRIMEYTEEELATKKYLDLMDKGYRAEAQRFYRNQVAAEIPISYYEFLAVTKSGERIWIGQNVQLISEGNRITGIQAVARDISAQKKAEFALQESERKFRLLAEHASDIISRHSPDGVYLYVSPACKNILGYNDHEILGRSIYDFFHPDDLAEMKTSHRSIVESEETQRIAYRMKKADGSYVWVESTAQTVKDQQTGQVIEIHAATRDISERKSAEETLQQLADATFEGIVVHENGIILEANDTYSRMFGYDRLEVVGSHLLDFFSDDSRELVSRKFAEYSREPYEAVGVRRDLLHIVVEVRARPSIYHGKAVRIAAIRDITERKRAEEALQQSESHFRSIWESSRDGMRLTDANGSIVMVNDAFCFLVGKSRNGLEGKSFTIIHHFSAASSEEALEQYRKKFELRNIEAYNEQATTLWNGSRIWLAISNSFLERGNQPPLLLSIFRDISEQRAAEQQIAETSRQLAIVISTVSEGITLSNEEGHFEIFNPRMEELTGYTMQEANATRDFSEFLYPDQEEHQRALDGLKELMERGSIREVESTITTKNGEQRTLLVSTSIIDMKGKRMFLSAYRDISDRKRTEEALRAARVAADAANKAKSDFLARMSHELRTPLNGILGYAQILKREQQLNEAQRRGIEVIQNSGEHLLELINDILDLSKIEAQRFELHPSQFDLSTILRTVVDLIKVKADEKKLRFVYETLSELPRIVFGDARVMKQVLLNLLGNAIKFTDRGQVTLQALYHEHRITFRVRDTGVGIPAEKLKEIFEPFKQVGDGMRKVEGTGLGLSISKRLVEMMKGTLSVESTIGSGSIFAIEIELPEVEGEEILAERTRTDIVGYKGTRKRILVADDNPGNIGILTAILTPLGFETIVAKNGQEAVDAAGERKPDLVLIDMVMPVMDGFDATRHIRRIPTKNALPIIAISASVLRKDRARYLEAGCDDFIAKPFKLEELLAKLRRYLGIEWIYQSSAVEQQKTVSEVSSAGQKEIPPLESLRRLYKLVIQGNFGELSAELNTLAARNSAYGEFIETIRQFADRYDEDGIIKYIEQLEPWRNGAH